MAPDSAKPALPPGTLLVVLLFLAGAVVGAVMAIRHSSTENLILGIVLFVCCAIFGLAGLFAWFKARRQS